MEKSDIVISSILAAIISLGIYMILFISIVHTTCLKAGYPDVYVGFTSDSSYCIDKYKSITIPLNYIQ